jgi:predicted hydrocarbon binding protein
MPENISFFVMSGNALKNLGDELQILVGEKASHETIERYGVRCGEGLVQSIDIRCKGTEELRDLLPGVLIETGLGRVDRMDIAPSEVTISFEDSVEANSVAKTTVPACHFTRGYLSGVLSALLDRRFTATEESCMAKGDKRCVHRLVQSAEIRPEYEVGVKDGVLAPEVLIVSGKAKEGAQGAPAMRFLEGGTGYLVKDETGERSYELFAEHVKHGYQGLCVTRDFPAKVKKKYGFEKTPVIWLSTTEGEATVAPQNLSGLYYNIENFMRRSERGIIILAGLEYLISHNTYQSVLKFIQLVNELISVKGAVLIVPLSPLTLEEKDLKMVERELTIYEGK